MYRTAARILAVGIGLLGLIGLFIEDGHLFGVMNADIGIDVLRLVLATALAYVGFGNASLSAARTVLGVVGAVYVLLGVLAIADRELMGLAPNGFTTFDIVLHLVVGVGTLAVIARAERPQLATALSRG